MTQSQHDRRIDYIEMEATDIAAAKQFYSRVFGWKFTDYGPDYTSFEDGRLSGGFTKVERARAPGRPNPLVVILADDLAGMERAITAAGGVITERHEFPGGRRFHYQDPVGNTLAVWTHKEP